jgi:aminoglycoside phosphotransferase (APT) family kinase protein
VGWRGDLARLDREMALAEHLPSVIGYPRVLGHGRTSTGDPPLAWSLTRQLDGELLDSAWVRLDGPRRRSSVAQLAEMLRELHRWSPPDDIVARLHARPAPQPDDVGGMIGADVVSLPAARARAVATFAAGLPDVDSGLLSAAAAAIDELRHLDPVVDDAGRHGLVHGDLHLSNLWLSPSGTLTILDFEWARFAPPDLEVQRLCYNADDDVLAGRDLHPTLLRWLAADYPELFRAADLVDRQRLYSLAYAVRQLFVSPSERRETAVRLRRLIDGRWPAPGSLPVIDA